MNKKPLVFIGLALLCVISLLLLPKTKTTVTAPIYPTMEYEFLESDVQFYLENNKLYEQTLDQYKQLANFLFTSIDLSNDQINELADTFTTHQLLLNKRSIYSDVTVNSPLMIEINKFISEFVTDSDLPQVKKILDLINKNQDYKQLSILSEHPLQTYSIDEANKKSTILYHENPKELRELSSSLTFEVSPNLKDTFYFRSNEASKTITIYDENYETNEIFYENYFLPEYQRYDYLNTQLTMLHNAIKSIIHYYPNQEELALYIKDFSIVSANVTDAFELNQTLDINMNTSATPVISIILQNPFMPVVSTTVFEYLVHDLYELSLLQAKNNEQLISTHYNFYNETNYISSHHLVNVTDQPVEIYISSVLQDRLNLSSNVITIQNKLNNFSYPIIEKKDSLELSNDYNIVRQSNLIDSEISLIEGKKLLNNLLLTLTVEQQKEVLSELVQRKITVNGLDIDILLSPGWDSTTLFSTIYSISPNETLSSFLLENENYYSLIKENLLSKNSFENAVTIENSSSFNMINWDNLNNRGAYYFTTDLNSAFLEMDIDLSINEEFLTLDNPFIRLKPYYHSPITIYYSEELVTARRNNIVQDIFDLELNLLKSAFEKIIDFLDESTIIEIVDNSLVWQDLTLTIDDKVVTFEQSHYSKPSNVMLDVMITSPLLAILPDKIYTYYTTSLKNKFVIPNKHVKVNDWSDMHSIYASKSTLYISQNIYIHSLPEKVDLNFGPILVEKFNLPMETITFSK